MKVGLTLQPGSLLMRHTNNRIPCVVEDIGIEHSSKGTCPTLQPCPSPLRSTCPSPLRSTLPLSSLRVASSATQDVGVEQLLKSTSYTTLSLSWEWVYFVGMPWSSQCWMDGPSARSVVVIANACGYLLTTFYGSLWLYVCGTPRHVRTKNRYINRTNITFVVV